MTVTVMASLISTMSVLARAPHLRDYQVKTASALLNGMPASPGGTFTVMFPRQAGKNEVAAVVVACLLRAHAWVGGTVVVCAPTLYPQAEISEERLSRVLSFSERLFPAECASRIDGNVVTVGRASAIFLSASPAAHVAGHTASIALIADEAQDIDSDWFNRQFRPMAASTGAPTVLLGTPWDGQTLLEQAAELNRQQDAAAPRSLKRHFQVSWRDVADTKAVYGDYVRSERERLGPNHPLFLSQYELVAAEGSGRLFGAVHLQLIEGDHARLVAPVPGERYVAGLDVAGEGEFADVTVLTIGRVVEERCEVVRHLAWIGAEFGVMVAEVVELCRRWAVGRLTVDATGMGAPLAAQLEKERGLVVERFVFGRASKAELGFGMLAAVDGGRLRLYRDDGSPESVACWRELRECRASYQGHGRMTWGAPAGAHDDYVASLGLCLRAAERLGAPRTAMGRSRG